MNVDTSFNVLSLCSGVGGLDLGIRLSNPDARTVCYCERESYAIEVLAERMEEKLLDAAPLWTDIATFDGKPWRGVVDCIAGGYPCTPFSQAGKRLGKDDPRHLWPHVKRIIGEVQPAWCFFENVRGHLTLGFDVVYADLRELGYRVAAGIFSASEVGAPHRRERLYILAHAEQIGPRRLPYLAARHNDDGETTRWEKSSGGTSQRCGDVAYATRQRQREPQH
ncbi:MAG TPA: DNA cytosine methyltransferase, partial [Ktedonobacteraceae bacterium]|nr:DNA cytosine methyltransferase [Ktedonobacteraceae bacterium]